MKSAFRTLEVAARLAIVAIFSSGCASVRVTVESRQSEASRAPFEHRAPGTLRGRVETSHGVATLHVERVQTCERGYIASGERVDTTTRTVTNMGALATIAATGGVIAALGGAMAVFGGRLFCGMACSMAGATVPADVEVRVGGGAAAALGLGLVVPWLAAQFAGGTRADSSPYRDRIVEQRAPCEPVPLAGSPFTLRGAGGFEHTGRLRDDGSFEVDLLAVLPRAALIGTNRWPRVELLVDGHPAGYVSLDDARLAVETREWEQAEAHPSIEGIDAFLAEFPEGSHVQEARDLLARARADAAQAARDTDRRRSWEQAGNDPAALQALVDDAPDDAYGVAAQCRLLNSSNAAGSVQDRERRCRAATEGLMPAARERGAVALAAAERDLAELRRRVDAEAARLAAERERALQAEARAQAQVRARVASAEARARGVVARCRAGARGPATARDGYNALLGGGAQVPAPVRAQLTREIAGACQCTPTCAGVAMP